MVIVILSFNLISTHAPAGGATGSLDKWDFRSRNFYSRPCGRGDDAACRNLVLLGNFYSRPCGRGDTLLSPWYKALRNFYSRPCGRGDFAAYWRAARFDVISTHAPAGGATLEAGKIENPAVFLLTPLREGRPGTPDVPQLARLFLLTPLREGRPSRARSSRRLHRFLLTPLREGRLLAQPRQWHPENFYSRPCGRGDDFGVCLSFGSDVFLLTPLREGRLSRAGLEYRTDGISTHAPAGGATGHGHDGRTRGVHFYSRPCGRGDSIRPAEHGADEGISTHAPAGGATSAFLQSVTVSYPISTHAPAGGATIQCP